MARSDDSKTADSYSLKPALHNRARAIRQVADLSIYLSIYTTKEIVRLRAEAVSCQQQAFVSADIVVEDYRGSRFIVANSMKVVSLDKTDKREEQTEAAVSKSVGK